MSIIDHCRQQGLSDASYPLWRGRLAGMSGPDAQGLKGLEAQKP